MNFKKKALYKKNSFKTNNKEKKLNENSLPPIKNINNYEPNYDEILSNYESNINNSQNNINYINDNSLGENVGVIVRIRPLLSFEKKRGDENCIKYLNENSLQLINKNFTKNYRFNKVISNNCSQKELFLKANVSKILDSSLDGYSTTIFAYGQTGSGKTYTIAGVEEKLGKDIYIPDQSEGIIPLSIRYLWNKMSERNENFYVKASFFEIYNEQLKDLLNPNSGNLNCRWNIKSGFFVEDLMLVECSSVEDLIVVLNQGMKHRKIGSHELNKDSSRSHSIMTIYIISETISQGSQALRKYGKVSFVDLAGSERLKESKSQGGMIKETQLINKSLFTLGKVISLLSDKKQNTYIPYRDSKLTMLLMDSLG